MSRELRERAMRAIEAGNMTIEGCKAIAEHKSRELAYCTGKDTYEAKARIATLKADIQHFEAVIEILTEQAKLENAKETIQEGADTMKNTITEIRREVATIANRLRKKCGSLSQAFRRAWQIVKAGFCIKVAGITFGNRQEACRRLQKYNPEDVKVELVREYGNAYDINAIAVMISVKGSKWYQLGYLPRVTAAILSIIMDKGISLKAGFKEIRGKYEKYMNYGATITINA